MVCQLEFFSGKEFFKRKAKLSLVNMELSSENFHQISSMEV